MIVLKAAVFRDKVFQLPSVYSSSQIHHP
jgi:hypothetical protein